MRPKAGETPVGRSDKPTTGWCSADSLALLLALVATLLAFAGVVHNGFLNWDDQAALVRNPPLDGEGVVAWAFSTTHMSHYQPLSWLTWALVRRAFDASSSVHHLSSLALHLANTALIFALASRLGSLTGLAPGPRRVAGVAAALLFAVHPLRVEPVAWASGFPYVLALAPLLVSVLLYLRYAGGSGALAPLLASVLLYGVSLLSRAVSPGLPLALLSLDFALGRLPRVGVRRALAEKLPFAFLALLATLSEASARRFASLERVGVAERVGEAALAPFVYLYRTLWPVGLSPLDPLSLQPKAVLPGLVTGLALLAGVSAAVYSRRRSHPWLLTAWLAYLSLLGPASGLLPSGLQATADRYAYLPSVVIALLAGVGAARLWDDERHRTWWLALGVSLSIVLAGLSWRQVRFWRDSVTLWTRALDLNPRNDVALYNLAAALEEAGDEAGAAARYRELLGLLPDHAPARRNLGRIEARRLEHEASEKAAEGRLEEAVVLYGRALEQDAARLHSRRSRGMALAQLGRFEEALPDLRAAAAAGENAEPAVEGALAFALAQSGRLEEARAALRAALVRHPDQPRLAAALAALESDLAHK